MKFKFAFVVALFFMIPLLMKSGYSLRFSISPTQVMLTSSQQQMFYLEITNDKPVSQTLTITSYLFGGNAKKYYLTQTVVVGANSTYIFRRLVTLSPSDTGIFYFLISGPLNKVITVPVDSAIQSQQSLSKTIKPSLSKTTQNEVITQNNENSKSLCYGSVSFYSDKRGLTNYFYPDEQVFLYNTIPDKIVNIATSWNYQKLTNNYYLLKYPYKTLPRDNVVYITYKNCGTKTVRFYEVQPKSNNNLFFISLVLGLIVIFLAYYVELAYRDEIKLKKELKRKK